MIAKLIGAMSLGPAMFLGADIARADHGDLPIEHHEGIFLLDGIGAGEVFEDSFPTEFAPDHGKSLRLTGSFYNQQSTQPINLTFWLTWFDPRLPGGQQSSTPESYEVLPAGQVSISTSLVIPFTPEQVGVHIRMTARASRS